MNIFLQSLSKSVIFALAALSCPTYASAQDDRPLAFATAEGYGKYTIGGRGGNVYEVTNLNDSGPGSFRYAVSHKDPRVIVFKVSGTIELLSRLKINYPYITIAGQTAPGDGITIKGYPLEISTDEVIVRYIRVRTSGDNGEFDAVSARLHNNIILDHVSASWSVDETMSLYNNTNVTIQWCLISESLYGSVHSKGTHGFGGIWGNDYGTYHHNLFAHHSSRNPRWAPGSGHNDYRNNVCYNWGYKNMYGGECGLENPEHNSFMANVVNNYYKAGPGSKYNKLIIEADGYDIAEGVTGQGVGKYYVSGNVLLGNAEVTADNWKGVKVKNPNFTEADARLDEPWDAMPINEESAEEAFESVLAGVGCSFPRRDTIDERIISEAREGTATYEGATYKQVQTWAASRGKTGMIDHPDDVGGWPVLTSAEAPEDTDHDGIPDYWEIQNGLNPRNTADGREIGPDGYTPLDRYLDAVIVEKGPQSGLNAPTSTPTAAPKFYNLRGERVPEGHTGLILEVTPAKTTKKVSP